MGILCVERTGYPSFVNAGVSTTYSTNFPATENPISEGGKWLGGATDGTVFSNVQTATNLAYATNINNGTYDDSLALIKSSVCAPGNDQFAEGVYSLDGAYTPPGSHETELILRGTFQSGPNYGPLYEISCPWHSDISVIRQDGTLGGFTVLSGTGSGSGILVNGDVIRAKIVGNTITVYKNGVSILVVVDSTITTGQPGMGFFVGAGGTQNKIGWSSWNCGPAT
jgi:hypothetical protein